MTTADGSPPDTPPQLASLPGTERTKRFRPRLRWELVGCGLHGHELVGTDAAEVRWEDHLVVRETEGLRWYRCLRCDSWLPMTPPVAAPNRFPPGRDEIVLPLRGRPLRNLYVLRLIAIDRVIHFMVLAVLGVALVLFAGHQKDLRGDYIRVLNSLQSSIGLIASHNGFLREINHFVNLSTTKLYLYGIGFCAYAGLNAIEAVGLWRERRWAEYLTLTEVTLLVPLEIYELAVSVTYFKIAALVLNLVVMVYLGWAHRLFGIRGGGRADRLQYEKDVGWGALERATPSSGQVPVVSQTTLTRLGEPTPPSDGEHDEVMANILAPLPEDWDRALCVVAHPDDLEFGASSAVARWTDAGKVVEYVLATRGEAGIDAIGPEQCRDIRSAEQIASARIVGVDHVSFLDYPDGRLAYSLELRRDLAREIRRHRPEVIVGLNYHTSFGPGSLNHADHRVIGEALLDATRDAANRWVFPELIAEGLEPWHGVRLAAFNASPASDHFVDVTDYLDRGIASLAAHRIYLENLGGEFDLAEFLRANAKQAGSQASVALAVTFEVVKF